MLSKLSTDKTVSETATASQAAVQANHFGVMQVHNLKDPRQRPSSASAWPQAVAARQSPHGHFGLRVQVLVRLCDGQESLWRVADICLGLG